MTHALIRIITSDAAEVRDRSLESFCRGASAEALFEACRELDHFRRHCDNLYQRVRSLFFLSAIYRYHLPERLGDVPARVPYEGFQQLLNRRFEEAIGRFLEAQRKGGPSDTIASALAAAYRELGFQTLANQVRHSVRSTRGNQWMFRTGHPTDHPLRIVPQLKQADPATSLFPVLWQRNPVRMDLSHSGWSDIFFLGMDFPEGARVLNVSVDLGVRGRDATPEPPIEVFLRVIDQPVLRLVSLDLDALADVSSLAEVFDFARDYLGLLKAGLIAAGLIPSGMEGAQQPLPEVLNQLVGPGLGLELVTRVNGIPKGSRLAVSTNLLAAIISVAMRATGQIAGLTGGLSESERRTVAARAILGEWLGGSGGGWQDSGGVWPGIKMIQGAAAQPGDPEWDISRGRLLPQHRLYDPSEVSPETRQTLCDSLVLVHGGMAQNVGPILEMVTEKYLLRKESEWQARQRAIRLLDQIDQHLRQGQIRQLAKTTRENFFGPLQAIIPWASNLYTETLITRIGQQFGDSFWGFLMLGGMSGGGMGFFFDPACRTAAETALQELLAQTKQELQDALPFAMEPVVYNFRINDQGTWTELLDQDRALMPLSYYALLAPRWLRQEFHTLPAGRRAELLQFTARCRHDPRMSGAASLLFSRLFPQAAPQETGHQKELDQLLQENGFDLELHEQIRRDMLAGRISLAQNRLPVSTVIEDVRPGDVVDGVTREDAHARELGTAALQDGQAAVVTLAAGAGSRWTQGAGVVKALHPFCRFDGDYRNFIEVHLAKSRRTGRRFESDVPHVITTSYLTHAPIAAFVTGRAAAEQARLYLSRGRSVGLRMIPTTRDLRFAWEEMPQQILDEQAQKMRESLHAALIHWAENRGGGNDYTDNLPLQCLHPVGHWFEIANLLRNGTLNRMLQQRPQLRYLLLHNIDTLGACLDPQLLGLHIRNGNCLTFEVIGRRIEDQGGGLARINGQVRLVESLAIPREEDEFRLTYYNSMTTWIDIDRLLDVFDLSRTQLADPDRVTRHVRRLSQRMPTYLTLKEVKKRWGHGQEDIYPVAQFEKLWGDMSGLADVGCQFVWVPRRRGQQLKDPAQLDAWLRDGSADYIDSLCDWS